MPQDAGASGFVGELDTLEILGGRRHLVYGREIGIDEAVFRRKDLHEVAIVPDQIADKTLRLLRHGARKFLAK